MVVHQEIAECEDDDDLCEARFSNASSLSCVFPPLMRISNVDNYPRRSVSAYNKLPHEPLRLSVLKLDGSTFGIEVENTATVGDLKRAVEAAFSHLPKKGPGRVSWPHVWGQFCLCHEGQKLLADSDFIGKSGIKDADQLEFIRHDSESYDLVRIQSEREQIDSDDEPNISDGSMAGQKNHEKEESNQIEIIEDNQVTHMESDNCCTISHCDHSFSHMLRGWFQYRKLTTSEMRIEEISPSRSCSIIGSFKNLFRFSSNKQSSRRETWKGRSL